MSDRVPSGTRAVSGGVALGHSAVVEPENGDGSVSKCWLVCSGRSPIVIAVGTRLRQPRRCDDIVGLARSATSSSTSSDSRSRARLLIDSISRVTTAVLSSMLIDLFLASPAPGRRAVRWCGAQCRRRTVRRVAILAERVAVMAAAGCGGDDKVQPSASSPPAVASTASDAGVDVTSMTAVSAPDDTSGVGEARTVGDHRELDVVFVSDDGTSLAGTLFLPADDGSYPALVWVHASGEHDRLHYGDLVDAVVGSGMAFFSDDKRGRRRFRRPLLSRRRRGRRRRRVRRTGRGPRRLVGRGAGSAADRPQPRRLPRCQ
jgi:hypothetical protein